MVPRLDEIWLKFNYPNPMAGVELTDYQQSSVIQYRYLVEAGGLLTLSSMAVFHSRIIAAIVHEIYR